jgi:N-acetyl-alpha-D-glucosaminyl L-malate synthase BshA
MTHAAERPLRIAITCYPTYGGSGIVATELGLSLARRGHRVHFISYEVPRRLDRFLDNVFFHEVEVCDYPLFEHGLYPLALASKMVELASFEPLDLFHVHYAVPHATSAVLAKQILGPRAPKLVTTLHGTDVTLVGCDPSYLPLTRYSILQSDGVTTPSADLARATHEQLGVPDDLPIEVIGNFVDTEVYTPAAEKRWAALAHLFDRADVALAGERRPPLLAHVSNFRPIKRVDDVVRIFAEVRRAVPAALLVLVGDGPERSRVEGLVRELGLSAAVCFLGKQLDVVDVLRHADVFVLPSATESFGLAALEALSCGVPVVGSRAGGLPELVVDGRTGFLHPPGDVAAMSASAALLCTNAELAQTMSRAARADVEARWRREPMVARYEAYYRRILAREPTP